MTGLHGSCHVPVAQRLSLTGYRAFAVSVVGVMLCVYSSLGASASPRDRKLRAQPLVLTQCLAAGKVDPAPAAGTEQAEPASPPRLLLVWPNGATRLLSAGFHSACDPQVSFDGTRLLLAGRQKASDPWNIYEAALDGHGLRQITSGLGDCRGPCYLGTLYTLDAPAPWHRIAFVGRRSGEWNESGSAPLENLYSCERDGSSVRRLTFNLHGDADACLLDDGRLLLAGGLPVSKGTVPFSPGRKPGQPPTGLFAVNTDGTDFSLFAEPRGKRRRHSPCVTTQGLAVFVESDVACRDRAGTLAAVTLRRPLHSYRPLTQEADGRFCSPAPLPDGRVLVCRRSPAGSDTYGVYCFDPASGKYELVFHDPQYHTIQATLVGRRAEPDGRSSNVQDDDPHGKLYCLDVYTSDLKAPAGSVKRLRVLEGVPLRRDPAASTAGGAPPALRLLGEVAVGEDGSFNLEVPANMPIQLQTLDARGQTLRSCAWIWVKNHESRGCIGCHEDGELVPDNLFAKALGTSSVLVCPPAGQRRAVDSRRDAPIPQTNVREPERGGM